MPNNSSEDRDYNLWVLLHQTRDATYNAREKELRQYGISPMEAAVLFIIQAIGDEATPAEISRWLFRKQHSVTALLVRMEKRGLVKKTRDLARKNMVRVTITEKGTQAYSNSANRDSIHKTMSTLSEEEHRQLSASLLKVRDVALKEIKIDYELPFP